MLISRLPQAAIMSSFGPNHHQKYRLKNERKIKIGEKYA
jgi:hypothetical protein